jgi:hypothetical protein
MIPLATVVKRLLGEPVSAGVTVRPARAEVPPYDAVIVTVWLEFTALAETLNVAEVAPARTILVAGTDTVLEPEDSATTAPPESAAVESTRIPVTVPPLATEFGDRVRL